MDTETKFMIGGAVVLALGGYYFFVYRPKALAAATAAQQPSTSAPPQGGLVIPPPGINAAPNPSSTPAASTPSPILPWSQGGPQNINNLGSFGEMMGDHRLDQYRIPPALPGEAPTFYAQRMQALAAKLLASGPLGVATTAAIR